MDVKKESLVSYPETLQNVIDSISQTNQSDTSHYTVADLESQPICIPTVQKCTTKRDKCIKLCDIFNSLGDKKRADRVANCGTFLDFKAFKHSDGSLSDVKLYRANFCKDNLCPMCAWRRSLKVFGQTSAIMDIICNDYNFIFLTLTVPNVSGQHLSFTIDRLMWAWNRLHRKKIVKDNTFGYFRVLEITYNSKTNMFHPHFHVIFAVSRDYGQQTSSHYIKHSEWLKMWQECYEDDDIKFVNVKQVKPDSDGSLSKAVAEISKYAVKSSDFTPYVVSVFSQALFNRRLFQYGGIFKKTASDLKLDDAQDGDLTHIEPINHPTFANVLLRYKWQIGIGYLITEISPLTD